jgi:tetratricopeptide (TPR) repeat protein
VLQFLDRRTEALQHYEQAIGIYREVGARLGEANVLQEYGKLQEDTAQGLNYLEQSQQIYEQIGDQYSQSRNLLFIADKQLQLKHTDSAIEALTRASAIAAAIEYEPLQTYANSQIEAILRPDSPSKSQFRLAFFRRGWGRFVLLGLVAFILVLIVKLIFFS